MADEEQADELVELVEFLSIDKPEVRKQAVEIVCGVTGSEGGSAQLGRVKDVLSKPLLRLIGSNSEEGKLAATALVNLSPENQHAQAMIAAGVINRVMEHLRDGSCEYKHLLAAIVSNVTILTEGSKKFLQLGEGGGGMEGLHLAYAVHMLAAGAKDPAADEGHLDHLAGVLSNCARIAEGMGLLLEPGCSYIPQLLPLLKAESDAQREGIAATLKNICMQRGDAVQRLVAEGGVDLIPAMIQPLSATAPVERNSKVREALAEAVQVMAATPDGLDALFAYDAPAKLRAGYAEEDVQSVMEAMEGAADHFLASGRLPEEYVDKEDEGGYAKAHVIEEEKEDNNKGGFIMMG